MNCKVCGNPLAEDEKFCNNCGTPVAVKRAVKAPADSEKKAAPKVALEKDDKDDFHRRADRFGSLVVKERKSSLLAGVDFKYLSYALIIGILIIFLIVVAIYERKRTTAQMDGFKVTLPSSMRSVDDHSFEVHNSMKCKAYSNSVMEFTYIKYDASTMLPALATEPEDNDIDGLNEYYAAKNELSKLDETFIDELDEIFAENLKEYKVVSKSRGKLIFTYNDNVMVDNYVEMHVLVDDETVYQFSMLCSDEQRKKHSKTFDEVFKSIKMDSGVTIKR